jgi:hypothetical protein
VRGFLTGPRGGWLMVVAVFLLALAVAAWRILS